MTSALKTALQYAERDWYVFPIQPGSKFPYKDFKWKEKSTNDPTLINKVAAHPKYHNCNWALDTGKSGIFIVDVDTKPDKDGVESLKNLPQQLNSPLVVRTPSGGFHYYYIGQGPNSASSKLGPGLDTRGQGGYVLIPGSANGNGIPYSFAEAGDPDPLPKWLSDMVGQPNVKKEDHDIPICELDKEHNVRAAITYLENQAPEAVEGSGGDQTTYNVACRLRDMGVSEDTALNLMLDHYNAKCSPSWSVEDLSKKVINAYRYALDRPGNKTPEAVFPDPLRSTDAIRCAADVRINELEPRRWLLGHRYIPGYVTLTIAPGGVGKSLLTILEGLSIATDTQLTYDEVKIPGAVWLYNTEDPFEELDRRVMAAAKHYHLASEQLKDFYYSSGHERPIKFVVYDDHNKPMILENVVEAVINQIQKRNIKLFIVDPFVRCHAVNENDNAAIDTVVQAFQRIAKTTGCAISLVHHTSKGDKNAAGNMDKARGASALVSAARIAHTLYPMSSTEAKKYGLSAHRASWYVKLDDAKSNLAPPSTISKWFEKQSVRLFVDNDETTGTLEPADLTPVIKEDNDESIIDAVCRLVGVGQEKSLYMLAKEIDLTGMLSIKEKAIRKKLEELFEISYTKEDLIWRIGDVRAERGGRALGIKCVKKKS